MQRSLFALAIAFALILAACGGTQDTATQQPQEQPSSTIDETVSAESPTTSESDPMTSDTESTAGGTDDTEAPASSSPPPEGPAAPDFTLALGTDGAETFTLSQEVKPVFMVFWAEW